jgi:hypothetical protein
MEKTDSEAIDSSTRAFTHVHQLEDRSEQVIESFLLHGIVFFDCADGSRYLKDANKCWKIMHSFFELAAEEKSAFATAQPLGDTGYNNRAASKEQYQIRYGEGAHGPAASHLQVVKFISPTMFSRSGIRIGSALFLSVFIWTVAFFFFDLTPLISLCWLSRYPSSRGDFQYNVQTYIQ